MNIFKRKRDKPEICGYLDLRGEFHTSKSYRDQINYEIRKREAGRKILDDFHNIIRRHEGRDMAPFNLNIFITRMSIEDKMELLELYAKYIQFLEDEKSK